MKRTLTILFFFLLQFVTTTETFAVVNPLETTNNKYGIHIVDENDLEEAKKLVNSSGGEWGYVTMVITENDRDAGRWQRTFDRMRRDKIIPIMRLATQAEGDSWKKPTVEDAEAWASFLNELNWVVANRYVILFNEPNHAKEWGGELNPSEYAKVARAFHEKLKTKSDDFFILPAGFDQAARNGGDTMDIAEYYRQMHLSDSTVFALFDGWSIHAYPNPNFSGSPTDAGRRSIKGYEWEMNLLKQYGVSTDLPIFITETGWAHDGAGNRGFISPDIVSDYYRTAFTSVWTDPRIVMISPFLLNYQAAPFHQFSWKRVDSPDYYPQYQAVHELPKESGKPLQKDSGVIEISDIPDRLLINSVFTVPVSIKNTGQKIWDSSRDLKIRVVGATSDVQEVPIKLTSNLEPNQTQTVKVTVKTPEVEGPLPVFFAITEDGNKFGTEAQKRIIISEPESVWDKTAYFIRKILQRTT